jgi:hypothetical protein
MGGGGCASSRLLHFCRGHVDDDATRTKRKLWNSKNSCQSSPVIPLPPLECWPKGMAHRHLLPRRCNKVTIIQLRQQCYQRYPSYPDQNSQTKFRIHPEKRKGLSSLYWSSNGLSFDIESAKNVSSRYGHGPAFHRTLQKNNKTAVHNRHSDSGEETLARANEYSP